MPVTFEVRPDGILEIVRSGTLGRREETASLALRNRDERIVPGIPVIVDSRGVEPSDSVEMVRHLAAMAREIAVDLDCGAVALVVASDVSYGMARMYMALTEAVHPDTKAFRDYDEALEWLKSQPEEPGGSAPRGESTGPGV